MVLSVCKQYKTLLPTSSPINDSQSEYGSIHMFRGRREAHLCHGLDRLWASRLRASCPMIWVTPTKCSTNHARNVQRTLMVGCIFAQTNYVQKGTPEFEKRCKDENEVKAVSKITKHKLECIRLKNTQGISCKRLEFWKVRVPVPNEQ